MAPICNNKHTYTLISTRAQTNKHTYTNTHASPPPTRCRADVNFRDPQRGDSTALHVAAASACLNMNTSADGIGNDRVGDRTDSDDNIVRGVTSELGALQVRAQVLGQTQVFIPISMKSIQTNIHTGLRALYSRGRMNFMDTSILLRIHSHIYYIKFVIIIIRDS